MSSKVERLSLFINKLGLSKEAEEISALSALASEEELPKKFPLAFRYWIRDSYYKHNINQTYSPKWKAIIANSLFKKEPEHTRIKIYEAWKLIVDAKNDKRREIEIKEELEAVEPKGSALQLELFGSLESELTRKIHKLSSWLLENSFAKEAGELSRLVKLSGVRVIDINRAEMNYIADELLGLLREKLMYLESVELVGHGGLEFSPFILHEAARNPKSDFFARTKISPIINTSPDISEEDVLEQITAVEDIYQNSEDYDEAFAAIEQLEEKLRKKDPSLSEDVTADFLEQQFFNSKIQYLNEYLNVEAAMEKQNIVGDDIVVNYILQFSDSLGRSSMADGSHSSDLSRDPVEHTIKITYNPGSATLQNAILKHQVNNEQFGLTFKEEVDSFISSIKPFVLKTLIHEETHARDIISEYSLSGSTKWESKNSSGERTLNQVAKDSRVKGGPLRLLVVNYNNLFGKTHGEVSSYQEVYDRFHEFQGFSDLLNKPIPDDKEVVLIPSSEELYFYDKSFYVLSREEIKAHLNDILTELLEAFEENASLDISSKTWRDLISLSDTAMGVVALTKVKPVDSLIKTPLGFLDIFKQKRTKDFEFGMKHLHSILRDKLIKGR